MNTPTTIRWPRLLPAAALAACLVGTPARASDTYAFTVTQASSTLNANVNASSGTQTISISGTGANAIIATIQGAGHMAPLTHRDQVNDLITAHLDAHTVDPWFPRAARGQERSQPDFPLPCEVGGNEVLAFPAQAGRGN